MSDIGFGFQVVRPDEKVKDVKYKIAIMSGKGGVGKTFITVNLAAALAMKGKKVGVLDADIHGPSVPKMLGLIGKHPNVIDEKNIEPIEGPLGIKSISIEYFLPSRDTPIAWRGPLKARIIKDFVERITWGKVDYLLIDLPPGTGDEPLSIVQEFKRLSGVILITVPSEVSMEVVLKAVNFAKMVNARILGVIENMSSFTCPNCGKTYKIFGTGGGFKVAKMAGVPFLGNVPLDPRIAETSDTGTPFVYKWQSAPAAKIILSIADKIINILEEE